MRVCPCGCNSAGVFGSFDMFSILLAPLPLRALLSVSSMDNGWFLSIPIGINSVPIGVLFLSVNIGRLALSAK